MKNRKSPKLVLEGMSQYALADLTFNLVPEGLPMPDLLAVAVVDDVTANDIYRQAYKMAYNEWPKSDLGKHWKAAVANSVTAQMDFKTFCLYVILGYMITHEHTPFFPSNLSAPSSVGKVEGYRKACLKKFGASDARSLGLLLNMELYDIDEEIYLSEISFARSVTGMTVLGVDNPLPEIYDNDELGFSPYWLSVEHTYYSTVYGPYIEKLKTLTLTEKSQTWTAAQLRHRHLVSQVISALKRRSHLSSTIFSSRSRIMSRAAKSVLEHHGLRSTEPISEVKLIEDSFTFWQGVGQAVTAYKAAHGN